MKADKALLIIDMQKGSFTLETPRFDSEGVVNRINKLSASFRKLNLPVIIIQHDGTSFNEYIPDTTEWEILDEIEVKSSDNIVSKTANNSFYRSSLESTLRELDINELYITGCATDFCVESTVQAALAKDYNIVIVSDGHTTGNRPHIKAEKVIEHYNWVWQNMIPTEGSIEVTNTSKILKTILNYKN